MKRSYFVLAAAVLCPAIGLSLSGCGVGAAISAAEAANSIAQNGAGFNVDVVSKSIPAPVLQGVTSNSTAGTTTGSTTGTTIQPAPEDPVGQLSGTTQQSVVDTLGKGDLKSLDVILKVSTSSGPVKLGVVLSSIPKLGDDQFWQIAMGGAGVAAEPQGTTPVGAILTLNQAGHYVFANSDPQAPGYTYEGSLIQAAALATGTAGNEAAFIQRFQAMIRTGNPVYTYVGVVSQANQPQVTIDELTVNGRVIPAF